MAMMGYTGYKTNDAGQFFSSNILSDELHVSILVSAIGFRRLAGLAVKHV